jgi:hypothetical protein
MIHEGQEILFVTETNKSMLAIVAHATYGTIKNKFANLLVCHTRYHIM